MFKVQFNREVRIFQNAEKLKSFEQLKEVVKGKFKKCPEVFTFSFIDDEGDEITVQTDADLECFISFVSQGSKKNLLKLNLHSVQQNLVQQDQAKILSPLLEVQSSMFLPNSQNLSYQYLKVQEIQSLQFQELNQNEQNDQTRYYTQHEQEQLFRILRSNLKRIEEKIIENTLDQTYNQIIKQEVSTYLQRNSSEIAQIQIVSQENLSDIQNEKETSDIEDLDDNQLERIVEKTLLKQIPSFIEELKRKTMINVKYMLLSSTVETPFKQNSKTTLLL